MTATEQTDDKSPYQQVKPGACADPSCPVLHSDPANPIHPPDYEPGGPMWDDVLPEGAS